MKTHYRFILLCLTLSLSLAVAQDDSGTNYNLLVPSHLIRQMSFLTQRSKKYSYSIGGIIASKAIIGLTQPVLGWSFIVLKTGTN